MSKNSLMTISWLTNCACAVGIDMGFNAAEAHRIGNEIHIRWCDKSQFHDLPLMGEAARAYDLDSTTMREPKEATFDASLMEAHTDDIRQRFYGELLELA